VIPPWRAASALYAKNEEAIERYREDLREKVHERMADAIAQARDLDCECREKWAQWLKDGTNAQIRLLQKANQGITDFIQSNYARVVADLKRDIRIFTASNALVFLLILALALGKPQACLQLFVPGILAATAALACSYFYIFEQNWLLTILFNDYLGFTYLVYLAVVFALLCDITLNRARITTEIVNAGSGSRRFRGVGGALLGGCDFIRFYPVGLIRLGRPISEIKCTAHSGGSEIPKQKARLITVSLPFRDFGSSVFDLGRPSRISPTTLG
jgi:hypothetical protein